jgi:lantibiotic biosynthesis protein
MTAQSRTARTSRGCPAWFEPADFVLLRAPVLPIQCYIGRDQLQSRVAAEGLRPTDPILRYALSVGSPSLLAALDRGPRDAKDANRLTGKLHRFLVRMSTRPTPYGLFAGVALAGWNDKTDVALNGHIHTRARVDMDWLVNYVLELEAMPRIRRQLNWLADSSAWLRHGRVYLSEQSPPRRPNVSSEVSIAATPLVRATLELARNPIEYPTLLEQLATTFAPGTPEKVAAVLDQMWQLGFLRTELMPPLTVGDPLSWVRAQLDPINGGKVLSVQLNGLQRTIDACDQTPAEQVELAIGKAAAHTGILRASPTESPLQVDAALGLDGQWLSRIVAAEAARAAQLLLRLTPMPRGPGALAAYRRSFEARYGPDREVPLLELLDERWGLGPIPQHAHGSGDIDPARTAQRTQLLQHLALEAIREGRLVVDLDEATVGRLELQSDMPQHRLPSSLDLNVFVLARSSSAVDAGDFRLLIGPNLGANTAGRNLARFAQLLGPDAVSALNRSARKEESLDPNSIAAEIVYLPRKFRSANVIVRPAVRDYEVIRGVSPGVDPQRVIPMNELVVGVHDGRLYARWVREDVEVRFSGGHMLNALQAPVECRFLTEIGRDTMAQLATFDWGPAGGFRFLPRVQSGRIILSCAHWRLDQFCRDENVPLASERTFAEWFAGWQKRWQVPRRVYLSSADNRLLVDLDSAAEVDDLRRELLRAENGNPTVTLQEALPGPEDAWLPGAQGGHHIVELVVSLAATRKPQDRPRIQRGSAVAAEVRVRPPGSDWLYLKLYGPHEIQNDILTGPVAELCREMAEAELCEQWFFLRYADPAPHLRLRFHDAPQKLTDIVLPRVCEWASELVADGTCNSFAVDTYEREVERYGGVEAMTTAEQLFSADSRAAIALLSYSRNIDPTTLTLASIDDLLSSVGLDESGRREWLRATAKAPKVVTNEYRSRRQALVATISEPHLLGDALAVALAERRRAIKPIGARLAELDSAGALIKPLTQLCASYVHMHCNRLGNDPHNEARLLGLLLRTREEIFHRTKNKTDRNGRQELARQAE